MVKSNPFGGGKKGQQDGPPLNPDGTLDRKEVARRMSMGMKSLGSKVKKRKRAATKA